MAKQSSRAADVDAHCGVGVTPGPFKLAVVAASAVEVWTDAFEED